MEPESLLIFWVIIVVFVYTLASCYTGLYPALVFALSTGFVLILPFIRLGFDREIYNTKFYNYIIDALEVIFIVSIVIMFSYISRSTLYSYPVTNIV